MKKLKNIITRSLIIITTMMVLATPVFADPLDKGNAIKQQAQQVQGGGTKGAENVIIQIDGMIWLIVGALSTLGLAFFAIQLLLRFMSLARARDGRSRAEALDNTFWVFVACVGFCLVGTILGFSMGMASLMAEPKSSLNTIINTMGTFC